MIEQRSYNQRIMIVDDEAPNLKLLSKILRGVGYQSLTLVSDSREVVSRYKENLPQLILLDIRMPYLDGFAVMEQLKELQDPMLPPIVVLTAQNSKEFLLRALASGAKDFISKPFDRNELLMRVQNLLDAQLAHQMLHDQKSVLEQLVQLRTEELQHTRLQVVQRLGRAAEYRDEETGNHILRMSHMCAELARAVGWDDYQCDLLLHASPMHDVGKIGIPDAILLKPGRLDEAEMAVMKTHTTIGAKLLEGDDTELMCMAWEIALTHHEKWDGSGYPNGLVGEDIPLSGRIAALADVFDALTSERPYKKAWTVDAALELIKEQTGRHFCPHLVEAFMEILPKVLVIKETYGES